MLGIIFVLMMFDIVALKSCFFVSQIFLVYHHVYSHWSLYCIYISFYLIFSIFLLLRFGAGSEFGREAREEARRKKFGIVSRKYRPDDQPWILKSGGSKNGKK